MSESKEASKNLVKDISRQDNRRRKWRGKFRFRIIFNSDKLIFRSCFEILDRYLRDFQVGMYIFEAILIQTSGQNRFEKEHSNLNQT